jgi:hypothetical protein
MMIEEMLMARNFKINRKQRKSGLYLKLSGDFDGASAFELVRTLEETGFQNKKVYIDTCGLSSVLFFGQDVFIKHCALAKIPSRNLIFSGAFGRRIRPKGAAFVAVHGSNMNN